MNERIKELEAQCWETRQYGPPWFDSEKFAELIVRECAAEAHRRVCIEGNDNMIYAHLLEHFGVEE